MQPTAMQATEVVGIRDAALVADARRGDPDAFQAIVEARLPGAFRLASAITGSEADAADATRNALVAAWRELPRLRDLQRFDAWLHRILVNECRMQVRRRSRARELPLGNRAIHDRADPVMEATTLDQVAVLDALDDAVERLDPDDRTLLVLHHLEGQAPAEIAAVLHMPAGTAKWRLHEARQVLHAALEAMG